MKMQRGLIGVLIAVLLVFGMAGGAMAAWGTKELETEKIAVDFCQGSAKEAATRFVTTQELKELDRSEKADARRGHHAL